MSTARLKAGLIACTLAASLLGASPVMANPASISPGDMAAIEATAPLDGPSPSDEAVKAAISVAVQRAARGAIAMGLPWVHVQAAYVRPGYVGVQVLAMASPSSDDEPEDHHPSEPDRSPSDPGRDRDTDDGAERIRL